MFHAFISYSHRADADLAALLQRAMERLGTPWWRRAPVRVFRDDATLVASAALWPSIETGLKLSQFFVLLASPAAAGSPWVERELQWWLANRAHDRLLIAVTGGDIAYDSRAGDFDWKGSTCLPQTLRGVFKTEPLWVDLRFAATLRPLSLRHTRLRGAALSLAAAVRGVDKDQLESEDLRTHRRSVRVAGGVAALVALLVLSTTAAVFTARIQQENARVNRLQAESRRLASEALSDLSRGGPGLEAAVFKAALAWRLAPTAEARASLSRINDSTSAVAHVLGRHTQGAYKVALSPDGEVLATAGREGSVLRWNMKSGEPAGAVLAGRGWPDRLRYSRDGSHLRLQSHRRTDEGEQQEVELFRLADGLSLPLGTRWRSVLEQNLGAGTRGVLCSAVHPDGSLLALAEADVVLVLRVSDGMLAKHRLPPKLRITALDFSGDGRLVLMADNVYGDGLHAGRVDRPSQEGSPVALGPRYAADFGDCRFSNFSADGRRVALGTTAWQIDDRLMMKRLPLPEGAARMSELTGHHAPELDATGRMLAVGVGGTGYVWDLDKRALVFKTRRQKDSHGPPLTLSADGRRLAGLQDGVPVVWAVDGTDREHTLAKTDCGPREGLADHCLARICERLTARPDPKRWRELLGSDQQDLIDVAQGLRCGGRSP
jgi:hypothetical protein